MRDGASLCAGAAARVCARAGETVCDTSVRLAGAKDVIALHFLLRLYFL